MTSPEKLDPLLMDRIRRMEQAIEGKLKGRRDLDELMTLITKLGWMHVTLGKQVFEAKQFRERKLSLH